MKVRKKIYFILLIVIVISSIFFVVKKNYKEETVTVDMMIANQTVTNLSSIEAQEQLAKGIEAWMDNGTLYVEWAGHLIIIEKEEFQFDIISSLELASGGENNRLTVTLPVEVVKKSVETITNDAFIQQLNIDKLHEELLDVAAALTTGTYTFSLQDYMTEEALMESIHSEYVDSGLTDEVQQYLSKMHNRQINISANEVFSLQQWLESEQLNISNEASSVLASLIYKLIVQTNFEIKERHLSPTLPAYATIGYEARFEKDRMDLKWFNPNSNTYNIRLSFEGEVLAAELVGKPFSFIVTITSSREEMFAPKTIIQYSAFVSGKTVKDEGTDGLLIDITRTITDLSGRVISKELLSSDYYPPQHRVVVRELTSVSSSIPPVYSNDGNQNNEGVNNEPNIDDGTSIDEVINENENNESITVDEEEEPIYVGK